MSPWKERRFLTALVAAEQRPMPSKLRRFAVQAITWLVLCVGMFCVFQFYGFPTKREWVFAGGSFLLGIAIGVLAVFDVSREQWPVLRQFIDFGRVKARLSGSES